MKELKVFNNEQFGEVRTIEIDGKILFGATECAKTLGYSNAHDAIKRHCKGVVKHEGVTLTINQYGKPTEQLDMINFIPEGDIYRLIVRSKLPSAEKFESWIFDEVLPSIRKNGGYIANQENLTPEQIVANALVVAQNIITNQKQQLEQLKPKGLFADAVSSSSTSILVGELAKLLKQNNIEIGQNRLFKWLRSHKYLIARKGTDYNMPTQKSMELKLFEIKEHIHINSSGCSVTTKTPKISGKGQIYFINRFLAKQPS